MINQYNPLQDCDPACRRSNILRVFLGVLLVALFSTALGASPDFRMKGWATTGNGTTGGAGGRVVTVSTPAEFVHHIGSSERLIVQVKGTIDLRKSFPGYKSNGRYVVASNKSIVGLGDNARIRGAELRLREVSNVIIRNLIIADSPDTAIAISAGSTHVWVDHCEIFNAPDGLIDITTGADFVTVSWNRLHSATRMGLSGRVNNQATDQGATRVTYHHNWFNNLHIRVPYSAWGRAHIFNNYYTNITNYGIGIAAGSRIISEHNYFDGANRAYFVRDRDSGWDQAPGTMSDSGTIYRNISNDDQVIPKIALGWHPKNKYSYSIDKASDVPQIVKRYAGVGVVDPLDGGLADDPNAPEEREWDPTEQAGLIAHYRLDEGEGEIAADQSGFGTPLELTLSGGAEWMDGGGVLLPGGEARLFSDEPAAKLAEQIAVTGEMSVEIWAKALKGEQPESGVHPARIVTYSNGNSDRNFMVGHGGDRYPGPEFSFRIRTTGQEGDANGMPNLTAKGEITDKLSHYVATFEGDTVRMYRDGELKHTVKRDGALTNWNPSYFLVLGNETSGSRGWVGELHEVAIYDVALSEPEIKAHHQEGRRVGTPEEATTFLNWLRASYPEREFSDDDTTELISLRTSKGVQKLYRYALGGDSTSAHKITIEEDPSCGNNYLTVRYNRRTVPTDAKIIVEASDDLKHWQGLEPAEYIAESDDDWEVITVRDTVPVGRESQRFVRIRVELVDPN